MTVQGLVGLLELRLERSVDRLELGPFFGNLSGRHHVDQTFPPFECLGAQLLGGFRHLTGAIDRGCQPPGPFKDGQLLVQDHELVERVRPLMPCLDGRKVLQEGLDDLAGVAEACHLSYQLAGPRQGFRHRIAGRPELQDQPFGPAIPLMQCLPNLPGDDVGRLLFGQRAK